ncbi:MAG TPA: tetratricopeptide repeat protein [Sandaracinaceae bacterium]
MSRIEHVRTVCATARSSLFTLLLLLLPAARVHAQAPDDAEPGSDAAESPGEGREAVMDVERDSADDEEARMHFDLGRRYYDTGRFAEAAAEFREAYRLSQRPPLLYNLFLALREDGDFDGAIEALELYLQTVTDPDERIRIEARLASVRRARDRMQLATAPAAPPPPAPARDGTLTALGITLASVGGALLLGSAVTGALALDRNATLDSMCTGSVDCDSGFESIQSEGFTLAVTTDVLWITGAVALASGLVTLLADALGGGGGGEDSPAARAALGCSGDGCGVVVEARY